MSDYSSLKATINANVKANNNHEITGSIMNSVLNAMVDSLGAGYQFMGVATPTNPGSAQNPDYKCFYLATTPGTYTNLGGLVVADGEVALLKYDSSWTKEVTGIASADKLNQLGQKMRYLPTAFPCFVAAGADHSDDNNATFNINDGVNPAHNEYLDASLVFRSFLSLKLWGFDPTKKYVVSLFRYNYASTGDSQIRIAELSGNSRINEVTFRKSGVSVVGGVNSFTLTSGNHKIDVLVDYSLLPNHCSTGLGGYNKFVIAPECFVHYADAQTVATMQTTVDNLDANAILDSDLTLERVSNNIANPEGIEVGKLIDVNGAIQSASGWAMIGIPVTPGVKYTFGGFYLGRGGYYAFYNGTTKLSYANFTDPNGTQNPVTVTAPENATILYIDIASENSPTDPYANLQINIGESLLDYDAYKVALTKIAGYSIEGTGGGGGGDLSTLIQDLPLSADGSDIATGYAYINSSTGAVIVKQ